MNMSAENMSDNESSAEGQDIVMNFNSKLEGSGQNSAAPSNFIKFKLDDTGEAVREDYSQSKRNIIQRKRPDYEEYLERSSSNKSKKKRHSIGNYYLTFNFFLFHIIHHLINH
jgi:hypothetical protein